MTNIEFNHHPQIIFPMKDQDGYREAPLGFLINRIRANYKAPFRCESGEGGIVIMGNKPQKRLFERPEIVKFRLPTTAISPSYMEYCLNNPSAFTYME